jgi:hypothetical protein
MKPETPKRGYWDYGVLHDLLNGFEFEEVDQLPKVEIGIVVIPARHHADHVYAINSQLKNIQKVVLFCMGDEEGELSVEEIKHPNIRIWVQNPQPGRHDKYHKLGTGWTPHTKRGELPTKELDWAFMGQVTHSRRQECVEQLRNMQNGYLLESEGFTQGLKPEEYNEKMSQAKIIPCPSGPVTCDSFRIFESLELGAIPIADTQTSNKDYEGFWDWLFEEPVPFPQIKDWESLPGYVEELSNQFPALNNRIQAFWMRYKQKLKDQLYQDLQDLGAEVETDNVTVVIPVSPIPSHPGTHILDETIASVKHHLPNSRIIVTFDGVREEQENRRAAYEEHIRRVLWKHDIIPFIFEDHQHQIGMMRAIIDEIKTPLLLYVEQDAPLVTDESIEWDKCKKKILIGDSNMIRFHFEARIPAEHEFMMIGQPIDGFLKTAQWSSRPHLASTAFYRRMMSENFSPQAKCFIEDLIHGKLHNAYLQDGKQGWNQWRVHIYHPYGNIKRSYTTDGRGNQPKWDDTQTF